MHILILGAAGMVGRKLTERLLRDGQLGGKDISKITLQDVVAPAKPAGTTILIDIVTSDFADANTAAPLAVAKPDVIFHLAAIVSGEAEAEFDKGYRINLDGTRYLIDAIRAIGGGYKPRLVFTSSIAVFGAPFPLQISDEFFPYAADQLRHAEIDLRNADCRLHAQRFPRWHRHPPADDLRSPRHAEQSRLRIFLEHHPRAAGGPRCYAACYRRRAALACVATLGGRFSRPRCDDGHGGDGRAAQSVDARHFRHRGANRSRHWSVLPAKASRRGSSACKTL